MIEQAEDILRDLGFYDVRARHHELHGQLGDAHLVRIEVGPAELPKFLTDNTSARVAGALKKIGYTHVTLDLQGYRRGSVNEALKSNTSS